MLKNGLYVALGIVLATMAISSMGNVLGQSGSSSETERYEFHLVTPMNTSTGSTMWGAVIDTASGTVNTWTYSSPSSEFYLQPAVIPFFQE